MIRIWLAGLLRARAGHVTGTVAGVGLTVAMLGALGAFLAHSGATMTRRAIAGVPVDWQVELVPGTAAASAASAIRQAAQVAALEPVGYASVEGLEAHTGGTTQVTGPGKVLGIGPAYARAFPGQLRPLLGSLDGVIVAQQTAANLHVSVGDGVLIHRLGLPSVTVPVAGIADLPAANALFQAVGMPPGAAPQAPPDNVLVLPLDAWERLFKPQAALRPDSVRTQLHVRLVHATLPTDPVQAFQAVQGAARNLEARIAGAGLVGDNLAARLDAVRSDALYARVLFLFLGAPGALLAALLTVAVAAAGRERRRRDQALLRLRGASRKRLLQLAAAEALAVGLAGSGLGLLLAGGFARFALGARLPGTAGAGWGAIAVLSGCLLATLAILLPAWTDVRETTVTAARRTVGPLAAGLWRKLGLDFILLALAGILFWHSWSTGYQIVLAPEGVPVSQVDYQVFLAPALFWLGAGLSILRLCLAVLARRRQALAALFRKLAGPLSSLVAASMGRQRRRIAHGTVLIALAFAFAVSTAIFNTTYQAQAQVDAELTNGADVTITGNRMAPASRWLKELAGLPGVAAAQPMHHSFAYVGNDLQDIYGIEATRLGTATRMADAYFQGGHAARMLAQLAATADGVLVSEETVQDFQLARGDALTLRLLDAQDHQYHPVTFHLVGVVREFPTAPRDSFLVANAAYLARQTGDSAAEVVLLRTTAPPAQVAARARQILAAAPGVKVGDLREARARVGSSLTSVDLSGLTRLELGLAVILAVGATGLVLALGFADRQRSFAILSALGARPRQLGAFLWSEALFGWGTGALAGSALGVSLAWMLTKLLTGVFDPPPEGLSLPWPYLALLLGASLSATVVAVEWFLAETRVPAVQRMREL